MLPDLLAGNRFVVSGVVTRSSIAYHGAERAQELGAEIVLTSFGRARRLTERAAAHLPAPAEVLELDANEPEHFDRLRRDLSERCEEIDGALHAIAYAPPDALGGG